MSDVHIYTGVRSDADIAAFLRSLATVLDAAVVGVPDDRFGEAITALVELQPGATLDESALVTHVKERLAHFKAPKRVLTIDSMGRAANGKLDYKALKANALAQLGIG